MALQPPTTSPLPSVLPSPILTLKPTVILTNILEMHPFMVLAHEIGKLGLLCFATFMPATGLLLLPLRLATWEERGDGRLNLLTCHRPISLLD